MKSIHVNTLTYRQRRAELDVLVLDLAARNTPYVDLLLSIKLSKLVTLFICNLQETELLFYV